MTLTRTALLTLALLVVGGVAGALASVFPIPLPWLLGSLLASALVIGLAPDKMFDGFRYPQPLRMPFMAVIGLMIGSQITPEMLAKLPQLPLTMSALLLFVPLAHGAGYAILRRFGGYDRPTAFFAASPGGLLESIAMGEASGAQLPQVTVQQFLRIIIVIVLLPLALSLYHGAPVGSAAGLAPGTDGEPTRWLTVIIAGAAGLAIGKLLRLPAFQLTGPLIAAAVASALTGGLALPVWLVETAQVVVGTSLGARFLGIDQRTLVRAGALSCACVAAMLAIATTFAAGLYAMTGIGFDILLIAFAPGGVTEMSLVALSLAVSPAFVTLHHIVRILLTVFEMAIVARFAGLDKPPPP